MATKTPKQQIIDELKQMRTQDLQHFEQAVKLAFDQARERGAEDVALFVWAKVLRNFPENLSKEDLRNVWDNLWNDRFGVDDHTPLDDIL